MLADLCLALFSFRVAPDKTPKIRQSAHFVVLSFRKAREENPKIRKGVHLLYFRSTKRLTKT
jgi:hypothetical protein